MGLPEQTKALSTLCLGKRLRSSRDKQIGRTTRPVISSVQSDARTSGTHIELVSKMLPTGVSLSVSRVGRTCRIRLRSRTNGGFGAIRSNFSLRVCGPTGSFRRDVRVANDAAVLFVFLSNHGRELRAADSDRV